MNSEKRITKLKCNPAMDGFSEFFADIPFSKAGKGKLTLTLALPWSSLGGKSGAKLPLIVFLQGSGFTSPNKNYQLPLIGAIAAKGFAVATITHRNCHDYTPGEDFPMYLKDAKCAIRFLRANADKYGIDPGKLAFWGTSSGGNTALMVALTGDDPRYETEEYSGVSDSVCCALDCFGPTDLPVLLSWHGAESIPEDNTFFKLTASTEIRSERLCEISPLLIDTKGRKLPPILILQGDSDPIVPYSQSIDMYNKLVAEGHDTEMITVEGAPHEGPFWSGELVDLALSFIRRKLDI